MAESEELVLRAPQEGARAWLAISGGITVPPVLRSRSTDLRGNFGGHEGRTLRDGDTLPLGAPTISPGCIQKCSAIGELPLDGASAWVATVRRDHFLRIVRGPDWSRFTSEAQTVLTGEPFTITVDSDRMAARLDGRKLDLRGSGDMLSEAVAPGRCKFHRTEIRFSCSVIAKPSVAIRESVT